MPTYYSSIIEYSVWRYYILMQLLKIHNSLIKHANTKFLEGWLFTDLYYCRKLLQWKTINRYHFFITMLFKHTISFLSSMTINTHIFYRYKKRNKIFVFQRSCEARRFSASFFNKNEIGQRLQKCNWNFSHKNWERVMHRKNKSIIKRKHL